MQCFTIALLKMFNILMKKTTDDKRGLTERRKQID